jgi:hypothetical protein
VAAKKKPKARRTNRAPKKRSAPDWAPKFLRKLAETANVRASCAAAGVARSTAYERRDADESFAALMADALDDAVDELELEGRRRAKDGVEKPVVYKGELAGVWVDAAGKLVERGTAGATLIPLTIREYSDTLLIFLLKAHRPEKYRERSSMDVNHAGAVRHDHGWDLSKLTDEQLHALRDLRQAAAAGEDRGGTTAP